MDEPIAKPPPPRQPVAPPLTHRPPPPIRVPPPILPEEGKSSKEDDVLAGLLARDAFDPERALEPVSKTVALFDKFSTAIANGDSFDELKPEITRVLAHQPEKAEISAGLLNQIDNERVNDAIVARGFVEKKFKRVAARTDLNTSEAIAIWRVANNIIDGVQARMHEANKAVDTLTVVEKVDHSRKQAEITMHRRWEGTTPQGREIIRKKLFSLHRKLKAEQSSEPVIDVESSQPEEPA